MGFNSGFKGLIWWRKHNTIKKTENLVVASKEIGLEVNAEK